MNFLINCYKICYLNVLNFIEILCKNVDLYFELIFGDVSFIGCVFIFLWIFFIFCGEF